jgi:hypothetical protein
MATVQIIPLPGPLSGQFDAVVVDPGGAPTNVIRTQDAWSVACTWHMDGPIAPLLAGTWELRVSLESIGGGPELTSAPLIVNYAAGTVVGNSVSFAGSINFPAGTPALGASDTIPFQVVAHLFFKEPSSKPGPFAANVDLGVVQVYDDAP